MQGFYASCACAAFFLLDFLLSVAAYTLLTGPTAYLKSAWNQLDLILLLFDLSTVIGGMAARGIWPFAPGTLGHGSSGRAPTQSLAAARAGRVLGVLRVLRRSQGMRVLIQALWATLQPLGLVLHTVS
jgi:hypothetical protein